MGKTDWKTEAKALKAKLSRAKRRLREALGGEVMGGGADAQPPAAGAAKKAALAVSPLAPASFPDLPEIAGARFAVAAAGVRYAGRTDVMVATLAPGSTVAGVFTRSATRAASVLDAQAKIGRGLSAPEGAAIVVNSGNSNAFTGRAGVVSVAEICAAAEAALGVPAAAVLTSSTGVIGEPLPHARIADALGPMAKRLDGRALPEAARAIMTTDTFPKGAHAEVAVEGGTIRIAGIAKGSGMIAPDMATMLVYIFTDAAIAAPALQKIVARAADRSFNCITVDGDTSTSDAVIVAATGRSAAAPLQDMRSVGARAFADALGQVMRDLAWQVVRDGEGATKFVEVAVTGATDDADAHRVAMAIANSPLVKTAIAGQDANWGRVVMAVGKSGAAADRDRLAIRFGPHVVAENGARAPGYDEAAVSAYMTGQELVIGVDLGLGRGARTVWTCDLTHGYISINGDYRS
ncbi:MAG: bifunctional glutamate N-acetyltransferase/amino-acid acetyltransferase ArgJ [Gemmobacter sp.]